MTHLSDHDLSAIRARYEHFVGPEAQAMGYEEYSELYDQFVGEDLPRLMEHAEALRAENEHLRGVIKSSRLRDGRRGR